MKFRKLWQTKQRAVKKIRQAVGPGKALGWGPKRRNGRQSVDKEKRTHSEITEIGERVAVGRNKGSGRKEVFYTDRRAQ